MNSPNKPSSNPSADERLAILALNSIPGIGPILAKQLIKYFGSATKVLKAPESKLQQTPNIGKTLARVIKTSDPFKKAEEELKKAESTGTRILFFNDIHFPKRLRELYDAPLLIYAKGNVDLNAEKIVSIVGTRQATSYGKEMVEKLIAGLAPHKPLIVSGLAYGIDIHAHTQSLQHKIPTLAVMGCGIDIIYPNAHRETAIKMLDNGGWISENPMGKKAEAYQFPIRNRIIAGLSDAVIVIETAKRGGALITAELANNYHKDVFAVPGSTGLPYSAGCNQLIKNNKAHLLTDIKDLEYIMGWNVTRKSSKSQEKKIDLTLFDTEEQAIIKLLQKQRSGLMTIDELVLQSSFVPGRLASILLNLELKNTIRSMPGKLYKLNIPFQTQP